MGKRKTQITNYVVGCILLKGFFLMSLLALPAAKQFLPYSPLFLHVKVIQYPCSLSISLFLIVSVSLFFLPLPSPSSPLSLLLFSFGRLSLSFLPRPSVSLRRSHCRGTPSLSHLRPPALSPLFSSAPPPHPHLHPLCIKHVITECS